MTAKRKGGRSSESLTVDEAKKLTSDLVKKEDWSTLGWWMWDAFVLLRKGNAVRKVFEDCYDGLTSEQKELIEET